MKNEVYVLGANEYLEIWAKDVWDQEEANQRERSNTVAQRQTDFTL
jgi:DNA-binding transcriptional regulator/RsmH inhibitor MraZ